MTVHSVPTEATVKYLYGVSSHCAYPDCDEPLYRSVEGLRERVRNSTVAHIHARRSGGPRWDEAMTADQNRAQENLLLLCLPHSVVIDAHPEAYPPGLLREWKAHAENGKGVNPAISDQEVKEVLQSFVRQDITLNAEFINLGGGLGGGGGAIGTGAVGGRGGNVTRFPELAPPARPTPATDQGSTTRGLGFSEDYDGQPGGLTAVVLSDEVLLAAGAGGPGFAGTGVRSTTDLLSVSTVMLVNAVENVNGLLYILGGGWEFYSVSELPCETRFCLLLTIEAGGVPKGEYTIHVAIMAPGGAQLTRQSFPVTVTEPGTMLRITRYVALPVRLEQPGIHTIAVSSESASLAALPVSVELQSPPKTTVEPRNEQK
jgi:hypothetical protein